MNRMNMLVLAYAAAAAPDAVLYDKPIFTLTNDCAGGGKMEPGYPLGAGTEDGKPFTDAHGRTYVRDARGTIRRVKNSKA